MSLRIGLTDHARAAMKNRKVSFDQLVDIIKTPDIIEPHKGNERYVKGDLCVVVARQGSRRIVITILLRHQDKWTDDDVANRKG